MMAGYDRRRCRDQDGPIWKRGPTITPEEPFAVEGGAEGVGPAAGASPGEFTELEKEGLAHYSTASGGTSVNTGSGMLGKHILEKEKMAKYEPKIKAQAVRTMMSKDRE